jgi:hypothetical protein
VAGGAAYDGLFATAPANYVFQIDVPSHTI